MARISYIDPATIKDPRVQAWLDEAVAEEAEAPQGE